MLLNRVRCKESKLTLDFNKYERMIKENENIYELMKGLEELDLAYTKAMSSEYLKTIESMSTTYKDVINEDLQNKLEEYKNRLKGLELHYSEYEEIKDGVEVFFFLFVFVLFNRLCTII